MRTRLPGMLALLALVAGEPGSAPAVEDLAGLRAGALAAVNRDRARHGLPLLRLNDTLNAAAQAHADDMLRRQFYDQASPEGHMVGERFVQHGGVRWVLVEENIYRCTGCAEAPDPALLEQAWMESPGHRANILRHGLSGFGFGIAGRRGEVVYAVQTFAGPGAPRSTDAPEAAEVLSPSAQVDLVLSQLNAARQRANLPPMRASRTLTEIARTLVSNHPEDIVDPRKMASFDALSGEGSEWQEVRLESSRCGGCGVRPTAADIAYFADELLRQGAADANPLAANLDAAGFAMAVDGRGMKSAVLLLGQRR